MQSFVLVVPFIIGYERNQIDTSPLLVLIGKMNREIFSLVHGGAKYMPYRVLAIKVAIIQQK